MFSESKEANTTLKLSLDDLSRIQAKLSSHIAEVSKSKSSGTSRYLSDLARDLQQTANSREQITPSQRGQEVLRAIVPTYLALTLDESTKSMMGGISKGANLKWIEEILRTTISPTLNSNQLYMVALLEAAAADASNCAKSIDFLFQHIVIAGLVENNALVFTQGMALVNLMGEAGRERWKQNVERYLSQVSEKDRQLFLCVPRSESDHAKVFKDLSANTALKNVIIESQAPELMARLLALEVEKLRGKVDGGKDDEKTQSHRFTLNEVEALQKRLIALQVKEINRPQEELYREVLSTYLTLYLHDRGSSVDGMNEAIKQFQQKTHSTLFRVEKKGDSVLASLPNQSPEQRQGVVGKFFKEVLEKCFSYRANQSDQQRLQDCQRFVSGVRALDLMGEEAVGVWNELALNMNQGKENDYPTQLPFPDLIVNVDREEQSAVNTFQTLGSDKAFMAFQNPDAPRSMAELDASDFLEARTGGLGRKH